MYREARKRNIAITGVDVVCTSEFGGEGEPGSNFTYQVNVSSNAHASDIQDLIRHTDRVAEVHNTLRKGLSITLAI